MANLGGKVVGAKSGGHVSGFLQVLRVAVSEMGGAVGLTSGLHVKGEHKLMLGSSLWTLL